MRDVHGFPSARHGVCPCRRRCWSSVRGSPLRPVEASVNLRTGKYANSLMTALRLVTHVFRRTAHSRDTPTVLRGTGSAKRDFSWPSTRSSPLSPAASTAVGATVALTAGTFSYFSDSADRAGQLGQVRHPGPRGAAKVQPGHQRSTTPRPVTVVSGTRTDLLVPQHRQHRRRAPHPLRPGQRRQTRGLQGRRADLARRAFARTSGTASPTRWPRPPRQHQDAVERSPASAPPRATRRA